PLPAIPSLTETQGNQTGKANGREGWANGRKRSAGTSSVPSSAVGSPWTGPRKVLARGASARSSAHCQQGLNQAHGRPIHGSWSRVTLQWDGRPGPGRDGAPWARPPAPRGVGPRVIGGVRGRVCRRTPA